jgi:hypothetical protein
MYTACQVTAGQPPRHHDINPDANWAQYKAIILESVTLWQNDETSKLSDEDAQQLTDYFYAQLHEQLSQDYPIVTNPGLGVMRLRAAITEAKGAKVAGHAGFRVLGRADTRAAGSAAHGRGVRPIRLSAVMGGETSGRVPRRDIDPTPVARDASKRRHASGAVFRELAHTG